MAITSVDQLVNGVQPSMTFQKASGTVVVGTMRSLWTTAGNPSAGATLSAATASIPISSDTGAFNFTNPTGGRLSYTGKLDCRSTVAGTLILYDRMLVYGIDGTVSASCATTASKGVATVAAAVDRPSGGNGLPFFECVTAVGTTRALNITYTNQAGTGSRTLPATVSIDTALEPGDLVPLLPLSSTSVQDTGVRSIQSYTLAGSLGAGAQHLVILRQLCVLPVGQANVASLLDYAQTFLPQVQDNAALMLVWVPTTTSTGLIQGSVNLAQG